MPRLKKEYTEMEKAFIKQMLNEGRQGNWFEMAKRFGFEHGEQARTLWLDYRRKEKILIPKTGKVEKDAYIGQLEDVISNTKYEENFKTGKAELSFNSTQEIRTLDELIEKTNIDLTKYKIVRWRQNFWDNKFQVRAELEPIVPTVEEDFRDQFIKFLETYKGPEKIEYSYPVSKEQPSMFLINKQDAHYNKYDIEGDNNIEDRFNIFKNAVSKMLLKATVVSNVSQVVYVIGSDQFNSEFTDATTKGTPQKNILDYHESFVRVCNHEVDVIKLMLNYVPRINVMYIAGNHDEYVGWHLISWLKAYFRDDTRVNVAISNTYTKYVQFGNTAIMLNHGYDVKPEQLAGIFPMEFADWSSCKHYYIFTGDKHHLLAKDINGIQFFQLPALSKSKSNWDSRKCFAAKNEITGFLITESDGISDIYKVPA